MFNLMMMSGRPVINKIINISSDQVDWNLITDGFGGTPPPSETSVVLTVESGVNVSSSARTIPAMDLTGLPAGSTIRLINLGQIYGMGGTGGDGQDVFTELLV